MLQLNKAIYLTDKYRASEFRMSFNIILFGNRIASLLYKMLNKNRSIMLFLKRISVSTVHSVFNQI